MSLKTELTPKTDGMSHEKINDLRRKVLRGEEVTPEELRDAIRFQVAQRGYFAQQEKNNTKIAKAEAKTKKAVDADALLSSLFSPQK